MTDMKGVFVNSSGGVIVEGIEKSFGGVSALRGIDFAAEPGEILGLLGPNGAGKTTTVNILSTLLTLDRGHASVAGHDVVRDVAGVRRSIMLTGQFAALDNLLSGYENLVMFGRLQGLSKRAAKARADELLDIVELTDVASRRVGTYSGGMRRRIDIACGLVVRPEVVFLDEPTTGLDPRSRQGIWDLVRTFRDEGITTLLTTQYLEEADALCDRIVVIDHGTVVADGTADELKASTGTSYCEIVPLHRRELAIMESVLESLAPQRDTSAAMTSERLTIHAPDGAKTVAEVLRLLDSAGIELADVALRRPSLDEVFLSLTAPAGRHAAAETRTPRKKKVHP